MKRMLSWSFGLLACFGLFIPSLYPSVALGATCEKWAGKVVSAQGSVEVQRVGATEWEPAKLNETYCPGDVVRVGERSRADIALVNDSLLRLNEKTTITLGALKEERTSLVDMLKGAAYFFSRVPRSLEMTTPSATAGVRGTEFFVKADEKSTFISVFHGSVLAANQAGSVALASGQSAVAEAGKAPVLVVVVRPRDAVQWALYYPPVIYRPPEKITPEEAMRDPRLLAQRASQLLAVGRVDEAKADIERALSLDPKYSDAYALQSIIAVVQNDKEKALTLAQKAVETGPTSATARIALSYAQQARFDLEGARKSVEEAVKLDPENVLAWARLADLQASFGELGKALEAAKKAESLNPDLSLTQTVLGFAYLTQVDIKDSKVAFEKAIRLDQAAPLPRLGLGLAKIREGDLKEGGKEIEIAGSLDPNNSLIRSYLGKVYYEEKRTDQDGPEYQLAKELDPNDPTPYFYDAIRKQTINRPVEALRDYQKAIELNDNRAVYRSKLMLDSDEAARESALARIYNDLGFQQRALAEGWSAVNSDPTNYSAHRFLADSYSALPRREIARVSELLQSQLLQPINITPIQPRLAESSLYLISAQGPTATSFNEFNPLFNRNQVAIQGSGLVGENDTYSGEGVVSGIYDKLSFSTGYSYFDTNGWHKNANQTDKIANVYAQYEFTPKTSVQAEYRWRDNETGDILQYYWPDNNFPYKQDEEKSNRVRFGLRQEFSPGSILLGNFQYAKNDANGSAQYNIDPAAFGLPPPPVVDNYTYDFFRWHAYSGELSYLFRSEYLDAVSGAGYFDINQRLDYADTYVWPGPPPIDFGTYPYTSAQEIRHENIYSYLTIKPLKRLMITVGGSGDFYNSNDKEDNQLDFDKNEFNPKFGVTWHPFDDTTVRGAVFRTFKRTLIADQTLEPTQVAGFNQFFDDIDATETWVYGIGVDQKFTQNIYGGTEFSYRNLSVPYLTADPNTGSLSWKDIPWHEYWGRAYLYWTPHDWLAFRVEYAYEKSKFDETINFGVERVATYSVPLGVNFFHPSGLFAGLKATWYYQDGRFVKWDTETFETADNDFWLVDAVVGYRLPKRYGIITAGVTNLFDKHNFNYWETDLRNQRIQPDRQAFLKLTVALP
jgi:tetratricopeptide (TPR) repeat protein